MPSWIWQFWPSRRDSAVVQQSQQFQQIILTHKYVVALFAFLVSVDLIEIVGVLCFQLFTATYFPWHLYPMMLNRAVELVAFICSRGYIPSLYSVAQILLSLLSLAVYAKRQPCNKYNCSAPLVLYSILLCYQIFVALMVVKVSRMPMADDDGQIIANWPTAQISPVADSDDNNGARSLVCLQGIQIIGLSPRAIRARIISQVVPQEGAAGNSGSIADKSSEESTEIIYAVQQPDGQKLAIARLCQTVNDEEGYIHEDTRPCKSKAAPVGAEESWSHAEQSITAVEAESSAVEVLEHTSDAYEPEETLEAAEGTAPGLNNLA